MNKLSSQYFRDAKIYMGTEPVIASCAVIRNDRILMGLRRDNMKWTFPGGHADAGESPLEACMREVFEETGLTACSIEYLGHKYVPMTKDGKGRHIFCFKAQAFGGDPITGGDPDREILEWKFVKKEMEPMVGSMLHSNPNALLDHLGWRY